MTARPRAHRLLRTSAFVVPVVALALCGSVAVVHALTKGGAGTRAAVAFVGDSNIVRGSGYFVHSLDFGSRWNKPDHTDNNYLLFFAVRSGSGIRTIDCPYNTSCPTHDFWKTKLRTLFARSKPDAIVTDLGINDSLWRGAPDTLGYSEYAQKIDWFMELLPAHRPVFWTNTPCAVEPPKYRDGCAVVNQELLSARARWPELRIINWAKVADTHPGYMTDEVHYTAAGYQALAALITHALDARFPAH